MTHVLDRARVEEFTDTLAMLATTEPHEFRSAVATAIRAAKATAGVIVETVGGIIEILEPSVLDDMAEDGLIKALLSEHPFKQYAIHVADVIASTDMKFVVPHHAADKIVAVALADLVEMIGRLAKYDRGIAIGHERRRVANHALDVLAAPDLFHDIWTVFGDRHGWKGIAVLLHTSAPTLRSWRNGESVPSGDDRRQLASVAAACRLVHSRIADPADLDEYANDTKIEAFGDKTLYQALTDDARTVLAALRRIME